MYNGLCNGSSQDNFEKEHIWKIIKFKIDHKTTVTKYGISMRPDIQTMEENRQKQIQIHKVSWFSTKRLG